MFIKSFAEGEAFQCAGNCYVMLLPREMSECCEVVLERVAVGDSTPPNAHASFVQVYVLVVGQAEIHIGDETRSVSAPALAYIPKNTHHRVMNTGSVEVQYLYITMWPDGIPPAEREGGWRKAYADMIQEYADRGYPAQPVRRTSPSGEDLTIDKAADGSISSTRAATTPVR